MTEQQTPYVVCKRLDGRLEDYLFRHPESQALVQGSQLDNSHCYPPVHFSHAEALRLAQQLGRDWTVQVAPKPCASCGREIWANDLDFCYPGNRERTKWRAGCNEHDFGCGFEVEGTSFESAMAAWNSPVLYDYGTREYSRVEGKGGKALREELLRVCEDYPEYGGPQGCGFDAMVDTFAKDPFYRLHFVARHYLRLVEMRRA